MAKGYVLGFIFMIAAVVSYADDDSYWQNRNTADGAKAGYEYYKQQYNNEKNYENAWKFARAAHFYADNFLTNAASKKVIFTEGKLAAESATNLDPQKVEGHYYLGICLGSWAEANGILDSLAAADLILREATKVITIDPSYEDGAGYALRGRVYQEAPGFISVGDMKKAREDYEKAIEIGHKNRTAFRFYAEMLMDSDKKKAKDMITRGLDIPFDESNSYEENDEIKLLKELLSRL